MAKKRELSSGERAIIFNRRTSGETLASIAKDFGITPEGVRDICTRLKDREDAENLPRSGRPRKTSAQDDRRILIEIKKILRYPLNKSKKTYNWILV